MVPAWQGTLRENNREQKTSWPGSAKGVEQLSGTKPQRFINANVCDLVTKLCLHLEDVAIFQRCGLGH